MKLKILSRSLVIGTAIAMIMTSVTACGEQKGSYDERIDAEINRMIADGELIDLTASEEFDEAANAIIEDSNLEGIFEDNGETDNETEITEIEEESKQMPAFVESDGPDTIEVDEQIYQKIGTSIQPGEYVFIPDKDTSYTVFSVIMDDKDHTIVTIGGDHNEVFNTFNGQYIRYEGGKIYPIDQAPEVVKTEEGAYPDGIYKVGVQIPAGEYVVRGDSVAVSVYDGLGEYGSTVGFCSSTRSAIISVKDGQYIESTWGDIYPLEETADLKPADGIYLEGTYKVGFHMPAGTYHLKADTDTAYVEIYNSSEMVGRGDELVIAEPETDFTVKEGQFVIIIGGEAVAK